MTEDKDPMLNGTLETHITYSLGYIDNVIFESAIQKRDGDYTSTFDICKHN